MMYVCMYMYVSLSRCLRFHGVLHMMYVYILYTMSEISYVLHMMYVCILV